MAVGAGSCCYVAVSALVLAVGVAALRGITNASPALAATPEFAGFTRLRGTDCLATRLWFDKEVTLPYSANPAWGFDDDVGMTFFDLRSMHAPAFDNEPGAVIEMDFYHAASLLPLSDEDIADNRRWWSERLAGFGEPVNREHYTLPRPATLSPLARETQRLGRGSA